jgi:DNA-binding transcriptional MerR regulator
LDKAPDAFRTISEVADDLDIPQHVLRFWETRFTQIKPMKRSGGRRYYRPDDVDLLRGIRRLLYGEGYTIRGVQRILKENGIKSVQGLVDGHAAPSFAPVSAPARVAPKRPVVEDEQDEEPEAEVDAERDDEIEDEQDTADHDGEDAEDEEESDDAEDEVEEEDQVAPPVAARRAPDIVARREPVITPPPRVEAPRPQPAMAQPAASRPQPVTPAPQRRLDRERLEAVLDELLAARQALDTAMKDG